MALTAACRAFSAAFSALTHSAVASFIAFATPRPAPSRPAPSRPPGVRAERLIVCSSSCDGRFSCIKSWLPNQ
ncbi:hypothetical protein K438DRAFT_1867124 [Mycena galopus ATCC 62051]|nr:hypothetical protein K438DRAFT_1867124 [Mycena galopus ATCC 62051]